MLSRTRLAEISSRANFQQDRSTFANAPSQRAAAAGCVRERWGARGPSRRRPARSFAAAVRRRRPRQPSGGAWEARRSRLRRGSGVAAVGARGAPWRLLGGDFVGKKEAQKQKILFRGSAMSSRATKSMPIFATAGIQTPPRPPLESSRSPASIRLSICAMRAAGGYGRSIYGIAMALF